MVRIESVIDVCVGSVISQFFREALANPVLIHSVVRHKISCCPKEILDFNRKKDLLQRVIEEIIGENKHIPCE